jgi:hypothetical protein
MLVVVKNGLHMHLIESKDWTRRHPLWRSATLIGHVADALNRYPMNLSHGIKRDITC